MVFGRSSVLFLSGGDRILCVSPSQTEVNVLLLLSRADGQSCDQSQMESFHEEK